MTSSCMFDPSRPEQWTTINWGLAERVVARLQNRIALASSAGLHRKVRDLQRLLTKSLSARLISMRRVAQQNKGKSTPGVDGATWTTPDRKLQEARSLANMKQAAMPLRRVFIPKSNGKQRPLGIPCMRDRAHQALWALALQPIAEEHSDPASYGFRPHRSTWDAYAQIQLLLGRQKSGRASEWVLDADIAGFFDHLSHDWLIKNVPMEKTVLKGWLKAGVLQEGEFKKTDEGTPQGGVISPVLANIALTGMEAYLAKRFPRGHSGTGSARRMHRTQINLVRYADDFITTGRSHRQLLRIKDVLSEFLAERGLHLSEEKTQIVHVDEGFNFLGWTFRRLNNTFLGKIDPKGVAAYKAAIKTLIKQSGNKPVDVMVQEMNGTIRGWMNYHRCASGIHERWAEMSTYVYRRLRLWASKRHRNKPPGWVSARYWRRVGSRSYVFHGETRRLLTYDARHLDRIVRLPAGINPYRLEHREKVEKVRSQRREAFLFGDKRALLRRQGGKCSQCGVVIDDVTEADIHHVVPTVAGGADTLDNKVLLHEHCHYRPSNHEAATGHRARV